MLLDAGEWAQYTTNWTIPAPITIIIRIFTSNRACCLAMRMLVTSKDSSSSHSLLRCDSSSPCSRLFLYRDLYFLYRDLHTNQVWVYCVQRLVLLVPRPAHKSSIGVIVYRDLYFLYRDLHTNQVWVYCVQRLVLLVPRPTHKPSIGVIVYRDLYFLYRDQHTNQVWVYCVQNLYFLYLDLHTNQVWVHCVQRLVLLVPRPTHKSSMALLCTKTCTSWTETSTQIKYGLICVQTCTSCTRTCTQIKFGFICVWRLVLFVPSDFNISI